jgi:hypothetical protein
MTINGKKIFTPVIFKLPDLWRKENNCIVCKLFFAYLHDALSTQCNVSRINRNSSWLIEDYEMRSNWFQNLNDFTFINDFSSYVLFKVEEIYDKFRRGTGAVDTTRIKLNYNKIGIKYQWVNQFCCLIQSLHFSIAWTMIRWLINKQIKYMIIDLRF